jgi:hypothetical protein
MRENIEKQTHLYERMDVPLPKQGSLRESVARTATSSMNLGIRLA